MKYRKTTNRNVNNFLDTIDWERLSTLSDYALSMKINKIIQAQTNSPRKHQMYFTSTVQNIKLILKKRTAKRRISKKDHILTDHAFCRVLELIEGLDVLNLKNMALEKANNNEDYYPVYVNNHVVTILKKDGSA